MLERPLPAEVLDYAERSWAPPLPVHAPMRRLVTRVLTPRLPEERDPAISAWLHFVRSHWLHMPPWLLASHLTRKGWRRIAGAVATARSVICGGRGKGRQGATG